MPSAAAAIRQDSVASILASRPRLDPSASRTATSFWRRVIRSTINTADVREHDHQHQCGRRVTPTSTGRNSPA